jgi:hypothetical protein
MKLRIACALVASLTLALSMAQPTVAQTSTQTASALPRLVRFGGTVKDLNGSPLTGVVGITFALYSEKTGAAPLWLETQNVTADNNGHYTVLLGSTKPEGLPADLFTSEQARWVGVQVSGQSEQPRVLLVSAPYALKAGDAETIGGLPPSAFVLAAPLAISSPAGSSTAATVPPPAATDVTTTGGTLNYLPIFSGASTIIDSAVFQTGSGTTAHVGINTTTPATALDVKGVATVRGTLSLPSIGAATAAKGTNSYPQNFVASSFSGTSKTALNQTFQWQAEPAANDTTTPSGTLNLLYALGAAAPGETGLKLSNKGLFTFATGQTFPGTGDGSVTSVATGLGLKGGPIIKTGTLTIDTTKVPLLASANTFTGAQAITLNNGTEALNVTQNGGGSAIVATTKTGFGSAVAATGAQYGVYAQSVGGFAVYAGTTSGTAVVADSSATVGSAIVGQATNNAVGGSTVGVTGSSAAPFGIGTRGQWLNPSTVGNTTSQVGVWGDSSSGDGVHGTSDSSLGVYGASANFHGVVGFSNGPSAAGVMASNTNGGYGVYATTTSGGVAGYFQGNLQTTGTITTYNNIATHGNGVPSIVFEYTTFSNGSGTTGYLDLYTPPNDGVFRLSLFQECTTTSGGGTIFAPGFLWTLPTGGSSAYGGIGGPDCSSLNGFTETFVLHVKGGTTIQWQYPGMNASFQNLILIEQLL